MAMRQDMVIRTSAKDPGMVLLSSMIRVRVPEANMKKLFTHSYQQACGLGWIVDQPFDVEGMAAA